MDNRELIPVVLARATEQLRQERETFDQAKSHESRWFRLRLVMGYASVVLMAGIMVVASYILFNSAVFPASVVTLAGAALFADVLSLLVGVWKIALNPTLSARLGPVTKTAIGNGGSANELSVTTNSRQTEVFQASEAVVSSERANASFPGE